MTQAIHSKTELAASLPLLGTMLTNPLPEGYRETISALIFLAWEVATSPDSSVTIKTTEE